MHREERAVDIHGAKQEHPHGQHRCLQEHRQKLETGNQDDEPTLARSQEAAGAEEPNRRHRIEDGAGAGTGAG